MSNILKSKVLLGAMIVAAVFAGGMLLIASSVNAAYMHTVTLKQGMSGAQVTSLQGTLGVTPMSGYFGSITKAAVVAFQSAHGLTADGVVGPATGAALSAVVSTGGGSYPAGCTSTAGYSTTTGMQCNGGSSLPAGCTSTAGYSSTTGEKCDATTPSTPTTSGEEGSLTNFDNIAQYSSENVGEDESDVEVLGEEMEADGSDQTIERVTVIFDNPSDVAEDDLEDFITEVSVMLDGEALDSMDVSDASYDRTADEYTFRFTGLDGVIEDGETGDLVVAVSATSNVSSDIDGEGWDVTIDSIRATSPNGVTEVYDTDLSGTTEDFTLETFASANNVELKAKKSSDTPVEGIVEGDDSNDFDADLLALELSAEGSDITVYGVEFDLTSAGGPTVAQMASDVTLTCGSDDWSENAGATVVFDLGADGVTVSDGDTLDCVLSANMLEMSGAFGEGDSLVAVLDVSETDAEDESGEGVTDLSGSANGETQTFFTDGMALTNADTSTSDVLVANDLGETGVAKFVVEFDVTAFGNDVYLDKGVAGDGVTTGSGVEYTITSTATEDSASATFECISDCGTVGDNTATAFYIAEGDTETYRLTVTVTGDSTPTAADFKVWIDSINWDTDGDTDATADFFYTSEMGEDTDVDTGYHFINAI